jgi:hypothetical protein
LAGQFKISKFTGWEGGRAIYKILKIQRAPAELDVFQLTMNDSIPLPITIHQRVNILKLERGRVES